MRRLCVLIAVVCVPVAARAEVIYGLTNLQQIVTFDSDTRAVTRTVSPAGFSITGELLLSIDVRPLNGRLYGLSNQNNLYTLDPITGASTRLGTLNPGATGQLRAIDFNPTVDRLRVVTSSGNNLRVNVDTLGVTTDGPLAFAAGDVNAGDTPQVVNAAYTNSRQGATTTTLYDLDAFNNVLATQIPPNSGNLNTVGPLGFDIVPSGGFTGFDISGTTGNAYLVGNALFGTAPLLTPNSLYTVNLATGQATLVGPVSGVNGSFRDLAVGPVSVPEPGTLVLLGGVSVVLLRLRRRG